MAKASVWFSASGYGSETRSFRSKDAAVDSIKRSTRKFAKRQLTWFRRDERIRWFDCADYEAAYKQIDEYVRETVFHDGCI